MDFGLAASRRPGMTGRVVGASRSKPGSLRRLFLWLVVEAGGRFGREPAALARQRLAAGQFPVAGRCAARKGLPAVGPIAQTVTMPGRLDAERIKIELLPQRARVLHVFARRQG